MQWNLHGNINAVMDQHNGLFSKSYQIAKCKYEAQRKNWDISIVNDEFVVKDSNDIEERVIFTIGLFNCSCKFFVENQSGTCQHIEAIRLLGINNVLKNMSIIRRNHINFDKDNPIVICSSIESPSIESYKKHVESVDLGFNTIDHGVTKDIFDGIKLFDFQENSIKEMLKNKRTVLCLKMGLGKTLCALACTKLLNDKKIIVICPNSLKYQWENEIKRFKLGETLVLRKKDDVANYKDQRFVIVNYEFINFHPYLISDNKFDIAIVDEIQKIKNKESKTWENLSKINATNIMALSGTVIQNSVTDLISIIGFLNKNEFCPEWKFYSKFCNVTRAKVLSFQYLKLNELKKKLERYIINPKIDYSTFKLPTANYIDYKVDMSIEQKELSESFFGMAQVLIGKSMNYPLTFAEKASLNGLLMKARLASLDARLIDKIHDKSIRCEKIESLIKEITDKGEKVIVYSDWIQSSKLLIDYLVKSNIQFVEFNGDITAKKRNNNLDKFIRDDNVKVMLSTDTGGLGVDGLQTVCYNIIHMEPTWNPAKINQRNGRLVRMLQKKSIVNIHNFHSDSGVEKLVADGNVRKNGIFRDMFGG